MIAARTEAGRIWKLLKLERSSLLQVRGTRSRAALLWGFIVHPLTSLLQRRRRIRDMNLELYFVGNSPIVVPDHPPRDVGCEILGTAILFDDQN